MNENEAIEAIFNGYSIEGAGELADWAKEILKQHDAFLRAKGLQHIAPEPITPDAKMLQAEIQDQLAALAAVPVGHSKPKEVTSLKTNEIIQTLAAQIQRSEAEIDNATAQAEFDEMLDRENLAYDERVEAEAAREQIIFTIQEINHE